jgi:hypothetical protein
MAFSRMLRRVALVRTDVSEDLSASFIRVTRVGELGTLAVASNRRRLRYVTDALDCYNKIDHKSQAKVSMKGGAGHS